jgi:hypothetical protein
MKTILKKLFIAIAAAGLCAGTVFADDEDYYLEIDEYLGQPVESVEALLGTPSEDSVDTIYSDYELKSKLDPDYTMYFPKDELNEGVKVRVIVWNQDEICSIIWAKQDMENYGDWIVFTSVAHDDNVHF